MAASYDGRMGTSGEGERRDHPVSSSRGSFAPGTGLLRSLFASIAVFVGLWLTVTPDDVLARVIQLAVGSVAVAGVMLSSRFPLAGLIVTAVSTAFGWILGLTADPFVLAGFTVFRLAEKRGARRFPWWMFAGALVVVLVSTILGAEGAEDRFRALLLSALVLSVAWVLGVRTREVEQQAAARSRAEERLRLARDVHDVLSHSLGAIGVRSGVAAHVGTLGAEELREVLRGIESDARSSLSELKVLLHREREDIDGQAIVSSPLSAALAGIARTAEKSGVLVQFDEDDAGHELSAEVRTTVLRIVQEAVTNVIRHAQASSAIVTLRVSSSATTVTVEDDGRGSRGEIRLGHGLTGMRERVELLGGAVAFTSSDSGFTVAATMPLSGPSIEGDG